MTSADAMEALSDTDRDLLRRSIREFLAARWPGEGAVERAGEPQAVAAVWRGLADQGLGALGSDMAGAGLREIAIAFEELGRAACPAPLLGAIAVNLALAPQQSNTVRALLEDVHQGKAAVALALGAFDGDTSAGRAEMRGDALTGKLAFVEGAQMATHFAVFIDGGVAVAASSARGVTIEATPGLAVPAFCEITFDDTPAIRVNVHPEILADISLITRLACAGRALGAAQRGFEMAVEHAKVRKQFGQFIGQFQAIQHKLANCLISLDGARMTLENAAAARDAGNPDWRTFASAAVAFAGPALRAVAVETHRALGAIGYAEEHEAPRHFRRVHADLARFGGVQRARAELADFLLGPA
ncbi:MAG: acyl-CoA/acyl-ACP dehydrogenase [Xanthobacteraceae bacterium]|nr:acyl-CoA/acyl-ACP dehydrogenase [Xanthobacteraceae bacterium]